MPYLIRTLIFVGALIAVVLVVRYGFGVTQPAGGVAYWSCAGLLAFVIQMLVNDTLAYCNIAKFKPYDLTEDDAPSVANEIPMEQRLFLLYPLFILFMCHFVWFYCRSYSNHHLGSLSRPIVRRAERPYPVSRGGKA